MKDSIRQRAWPALVGLQPPESPSPPINNNSSKKQQQQQQQQQVDIRQIEFDVTRCTWHLLTGNQRTQRLQMEHKRHRKVARVIKKKQHRLASLIHSTLVTNSSSSYSSASDVALLTMMNHSNQQEDENNDEPLYYYQGYHDVACIFLSSLAGHGRLQTTWTASSTTTTTTSHIDNNNNNNLTGMVRRDSFDSQSSASTHNSHASAASRHSNNNNGSTSAPTKTNAAAFQFNSSLPMSPVLHLPAAVLLQVSKSHFQDCMRATFLQLQTALRLTVFPLIALYDAELHDHLVACDMAPFFALPWIITWFAHEIRDTQLVKRIFDAFIVSHPLLPIYVAVAMVCHPTNRCQILETECDFAALHHALLELPKNSSMVGWKYQPGDGYVSDEEGEGDRDGASIVSNSTMDDNSSGLDVDGDVLLFQAGLLDTEIGNRRNKSSSGAALSSLMDGGSSSIGGGGCTAGGNDVVSLSSMSSFMGGASSSNNAAATLVPFQDLIDTAVNTYMRQIPPRRLLALSKSYYGKEQVEALLQAADEGGENGSGRGGAAAAIPPIKLFDNAPSWAIAPTAQADWLLKQHAREREGSSATSRRDRRRRSASTAAAATTTATCSAIGTADNTPRQRSFSSSSLDPTNINNKTTTTTVTTTTPVVMAKDHATIAQILQDKKRTLAVIATGYGPSHEEERRLRKRQKVLRHARRVALTVALSTVVWAGMGLFGSSSSNSSTSSMHHHDDDVKKNRSSLLLLLWSWTRTRRTMVLITTLLAMALGTGIMAGNNLVSKLWKKCKNQFNL